MKLSYSYTNVRRESRMVKRNTYTMNVDTYISCVGYYGEDSNQRKGRLLGSPLIVERIQDKVGLYLRAEGHPNSAETRT